VVWIFQLLFNDLLAIGTIRPDFLLILVLYYSISNGRFIGTSVGFILGLLLDLSGSAIFFGLSSLTYSITGYISGNLNGLYIKISPFYFTALWILILLFNFFIFCIIFYQDIWIVDKNMFYVRWLGTSVYTISFVLILQFLYPFNKLQNVKSR
jgi:rod shape-determining protein MreD